MELEDLYRTEGLKFHYTKYMNLENILKHGILSLDMMKDKKILYQYGPRDAQIKYGTDKISIVDFDGERTADEIWRTSDLGGYYPRPPDERDLTINYYIFKEDVTLVLDKDIETIPQGMTSYEHLVHDHIPKEKILAICCDISFLKDIHKNNWMLIMADIIRVCRNYNKDIIYHNSKDFIYDYHFKKYGNSG